MKNKLLVVLWSVVFVLFVIDAGLALNWVVAGEDIYISIMRLVLWTVLTLGGVVWIVLRIVHLYQTVKKMTGREMLKYYSTLEEPDNSFGLYKKVSRMFKGGKK